MSPDPTTAFLGLGRLGTPIAARLLASGLPLQLWNRSPRKAAKLADRGSAVHPTPAAAARGARFICLCLSDADAVEAVVFGPGGVVEGLSQSATLIDFSSIGIAQTREMARKLSRQTGAAWLDCPVSGGVAGAQAGSLVIFAGGDEDVLAQAEILLARIATRVTTFGPVGAGQAAKLCNQLIVSANLLAIAEAFRLGQALGLDVSKLPEALGGGFADSKPLQLFGPRMAALHESAPTVGSVATMGKDVRAIAAAAAEQRLRLPLAARVSELYGEASTLGLGDEDLQALFVLYREAPARAEALNG